MSYESNQSIIIDQALDYNVELAIITLNNVQIYHICIVLFQLKSKISQYTPYGVMAVLADITLSSNHPFAEIVKVVCHEPITQSIVAQLNRLSVHFFRS